MNWTGTVPVPTGPGTRHRVPGRQSDGVQLLTAVEAWYQVLRTMSRLLQQRYRQDWFHLEVELHTNTSDRLNVNVVASAADERVGVTLYFHVCRLATTAPTFMIL